MEKARHLQLELFSQGQKGHSEAKSRTLGHFFLNYIWNYEKIILIIIGLVITGIVSFSLGVQRGKSLVEKYQILTPKTKSESAIVPKTQEQPKIEKQDMIRQITSAGPLQYNYTIQLASYQNKTSAQKEAQELKRKGYLPLVLSKGQYIVLCVGNFSNKETARPILSELKKRYQDCFIRRL